MKLFVRVSSGLFLALSPIVSGAQVKVFTGLTLLDGTGRAAIPNATIVVRDGRIVSAGASSTVPPSTAVTRVQRIALDGKFVIPGLINSHGHVNTPDDLKTYAAYGITTVVSLGDEKEPVFAARAAQNVPTLDRARVFVAGPVLAPSSPAEARTMVEGVAARKVDWVKIRVDDNLGTQPKMPPEIYRAVIDEAHKRGFRVATHLYYLADAKSLLEAGSDFIAHSVRDLPVDDAFVRQMKASGKCYTPTLMREVSTFVYEGTPGFLSDTLFLKYANKDWVTSVSSTQRRLETQASASAQTYKRQLPVAAANLKKLFEAGVPIAMGTDTGPMGRFQGYFELMELQMMEDAGMSPPDVLASATSVAARCMGLADVGTLEQGKWADFVVLDDNPSGKVSNVRRISSVWIAGNRVAR